MHIHTNKYAELQHTVFKRVTHYFELCECGRYRRCDNRVPVTEWTPSTILAKEYMFSPSQTKTFSRCRWKWFLSKFLGAGGAGIGKRDLAAAVGTSVGAALQAHYRQKLSRDQLVAQAMDRYQYEVEEKCKHGRYVIDCEEAVVYPTLIPQMIEAFLKAKPIPDEWEVTHAETGISDDYEAYIDIVCKTPTGPIVMDVKCRMNEKQGFMHNSLLKYQFDPQLLQYCREWSKKSGEKVERYRIIYIVGSPKALCIWEDFEVDWDYMALREMSDAVLWSDMAAAALSLKQLALKHGGYRKIPLQEVMLHAPMASEHMDGFYKCDMWDPCLVYAGDVEKVPGFIQIERKL